MTLRQIASLICKALGLYIFVGALSSLPASLLVVVALRTRPDLAGATGSLMQLTASLSIVPALIQFFVGLILWLVSDNLAGLMVPEEPSRPGLQLGLEQGRALVFSGLGVWTLLQTLPRFGQIFIRLLLFSRQDPMLRNDYTGMSGPDIIALLIQFGLGCWLLLGSAGLARFIDLLSGRNPKEVERSDDPTD